MDVELSLPDDALMFGEEIIGVIGDTPVTKRGLSWLPITQLLGWIFFTWKASRRKPGDTIIDWSGEGILLTAVSLGSEWCHNLAHLFASNLINKPMDQLRILLGMPRCVYYDLNDPAVTPRQHLVRSLAGPLINLILLPITGFFKKNTEPGSIAGETAKTAYQTNLFLSLISLLPIPGIDGGPILKWSLVKGGRTIQEADRVVKNLNGPAAILLGLFSSMAFAKKNFLAGALSLMLGITSLSIYAGWLKEEDVSI